MLDQAAYTSYHTLFIRYNIMQKTLRLDNRLLLVLDKPLIGLSLHWTAAFDALDPIVPPFINHRCETSRLATC